MIRWIHDFLAYLVWRTGSMVVAGRLRVSAPDSGRVCVLQMNALGDVLMATPLLRALIDAVGPARVDVVVQERAAPLLAEVQGLGEIMTVLSPLRWRDPHSVWNFFRLTQQLRMRRYRAVVDLSRLLQSAWLSYLARPRRAVGLGLRRSLGPFFLEGLGYLYTDDVTIDPDAHMIRQNLSLLAPLGIPISSERIQFMPNPTQTATARAWLSAGGVKPDQPHAVIHPGAKWPPKRWPCARFQEVAGRLQQSGLVVVLVGDAGDKALLEAIARGLTPAPLLADGKLDLGIVGALIREAKIFVGNDSGLMHLASAVGTPVVALFGPTFPGRTGPLTSPSCAMTKPIECRPCRMYYTRDRCERGHNYCMDLIEVDEVWASIRRLLEGTGYA